ADRARCADLRLRAVRQGPWGLRRGSAGQERAVHHAESPGGADCRRRPSCKRVGATAGVGRVPRPNTCDILATTYRQERLMSISTLPRLTATEVEKLGPYALMAVLGKRVIHPGGRRSTEELLARADFRPSQRVLDVGCGVGTTAIQIARRYGAHVTAV